ncbi:MAG: Aspartate aminotransferase [Phycisphaerae bacterium]|nr:Aspartate aminotransferase [Phycisphaerae bacterium]
MTSKDAIDSTSETDGLNPRVRGLRPSATLAINERCRRMRAEGRRICHFGFGQSPFPVPESVVEALRAHAHVKDYLPVQGLAALRESVARHHQAVDGVAVRAEDVLIGPGSKELMFILQLALDADLLLPTPCWVSYGPQAQIIGRPVALLPATPATGWRITPGQLADWCDAHPAAGRPRLLVLNYPSNPDGGVYSADALEDLAKIARRHGLIVLSDEIYGRLHFTGGHVSMARFYPEGTVLASGLSKWCGAGGWRLGTFCLPPRLRALRGAMCSIASETFTSVAAPVQHAAVRAFDGGPDIDDYLLHARRILRAVAAQVRGELLSAGVGVTEAAGGFYLFPDFGPLADRLVARGIADSVTLCNRLLDEAGVALLPGSDFGRPPEELTARLAFVDFDGRSALDASRRSPAGPLPDGFLQARCADVVAGVRALTAWLA